MSVCVWGTLGAACLVWVAGYALMTGGLPHVRIWRPRPKLPPQARLQLQRRYDAAVHWFTRGPGPRHVQAPTEPFRKVLL